MLNKVNIAFGANIVILVLFLLIQFGWFTSTLNLVLGWGVSFLTVGNILAGLAGWIAWNLFKYRRFA